MIPRLKMRHRVRRECILRIAAGLALAIESASCGPEVTAPLPPSPPVVHVALRDYWFDFNASGIPRGRVVFQITNAGKHYHELALIPLPPDFPPIKEQVEGSQRRVVNELVSSPPLQPGASDTFAANLTAGRWAFVDFFIDAVEGSNAAKGDAAEFRVN